MNAEADTAPPRDRSALVLACATVGGSTAGFAAAIVFTVHQGWSWLHFALFFGMYLVTSLGVEGGLHRFFSHRSFSAGPVLTFLWGVAGSMAAQGPILFWVSVHRKHHAFADRDGDPHSPRPRGEGRLAALRGLWHSHVGWLFTVRREGWVTFVPDLLRNRHVCTVDRYYAWWIALGLALPAAVGWAVTGRPVDALGGLLWGGFARMFVLRPCDVDGQLAGAHPGPPPVQDPGFQSEPRRARAGLRGRVMAQQPPLPAVAGAQPAPLLADRHHRRGHQPPGPRGTGIRGPLSGA
ncbi:hypothetical protein ACFZCY_18990 [Streptomyces sp. NPDC007983]|uniref:hypothetical protein n=1 Tax=Streptomyces sp. NPDC007983 TaxID=3364800 RepID=UPI0036F12D73